MIPCRLLLISVISAFHFGCNYEDVVVHEKGDYPLAEIETFSSRKSVRLSTGVGLGDVANMTVFDDFWPGITAQEAKSVFGDPDWSHLRTIGHPGGHLGDYFFYKKHGGLIRVSKITYSSGDISITKWQLFFFPDNQARHTLLSKQIQEILDSGTRELSIFDAEETLYARIKNDHIEYLVWSR